MTKKKRKTVKGEGGAPVAAPVVASGWESIALPALGALALVFSWLAALGGVSDGSIDWRIMFNDDNWRAYGVFHDLFVDEEYSASGWTHGGSPFYFPDVAFQWALFALGVDARVTLYLFPLMQVGFAAAGWILVCDFVFGKSPARRAAVLLLHAATFLLLGWRESHLFYLQMTGMWHYGAWVCVPWLLWLSLRMLDSPRPEPGKTAALILALAVVTASDQIIAPWFTAPVALVALLSAQFKKSAVFIAALAAGTAAGVIIAALIPFQSGVPFGLAKFLKGDFQWINYLLPLLALRRHFSVVASMDPFEFAVMLAFAAAVCAQLARAIKGLGAKKVKRETFRPRLFTLLMIPACLASTLGGFVLSKGHGILYFKHPIELMRYAYPLFYLPLFAGWALLSWNARRWKIRPAAMAAAACAAAVAISIPKLARIDFAAMDPFGTPFQKCFAENARRLGWTSGILPYKFLMPLFVNPDSKIENYARGRMVWRDGGRAFVEVRSAAANHKRGSDEAQFEVITPHNGRFFQNPPRAGDKGCPVSNPLPCTTTTDPFNLQVHLDRKRIRGGPTEIVECAGIAIYHYDPPLRFDFPEGPQGGDALIQEQPVH